MLMFNRRNSIWLLILVLIFIGTFTGQAVFFNLSYIFVGLMVLSFLWSWLGVRGLGISRQTRTRRSQVGRNFHEQFIVRNRSWLPKLWLEVRDHSNLPGHRASHVVPSVFRNGQYEWRVDTSCVVRGEFQLGPMTITSGDPFGLFLTPRRINAVERMIVYPAIVPLTQFQLPTGYLTGGEPQRRITQNTTTNAAGVREYVPGDSINRVHWRSTARRGKLIVKEFELDPLLDVWMLVDFSADSLFEDPSVRRFGKVGAVIPDSRSIPPSSEEYSVIIAASLAKYFIDQERNLGFIAYTPTRQLFRPEKGHRQMTRVLETLAVARSVSQQPLREILALESTTLTRGATLVIITASHNTAWINEAQNLSRRGIRPMCVYVDPASFVASQSTDELRGMLQLARIPTITVRNGDPLKEILQQKPVL